MRLLTLEISNYRTLDGIKLNLNENVNFIVGRNNIGKTNTLKLLSTLFSTKNFIEADFCDITKPIEIRLVIKLTEEEKGKFEDLFSPHNNNLINLNISQSSPYDSIEIFHVETEEKVMRNTLKDFNYVYYDSLRNSISSDDFTNKNNIMKIVPFMLEKYCRENNIENGIFNHNDEIDPLVDYLNGQLSNIKTIKNNSLTLSINDEDSIEILKRVLIMVDEKGNSINKLGYGIQFANLIPMSIINELIRVSKYQNFFTSLVQVDNHKKKYIDYTIGLDEPEIHLHPHLQRKLIKYISDIFSGKNKEFNNLLKDLFDIDYITGQVIIVTHSPSILSDDSRNIIRYFARGSQVYTRSGVDIEMSPAQMKHFRMFMPFVKEAFFSKVVIIVEGDSELLAMREFAKRLSIDLDELEIDIIKSNGIQSVPSLVKTFDTFAISSVPIIDKDTDNHTNSDYVDIENIFITGERDFEEEIFKYINLIDYMKYLEEIEGEGTFIIKYLTPAQKDVLDLSQRPLSVTLEKLSRDELHSIKCTAKEDIVKQLKREKSIMNGLSLGKNVTNIPQIFRSSLLKAKELSNDRQY